MIRCSINRSMRKLPTAVVTTISRMMLKEIAITTTTVVRLFLPRLEIAMDKSLKWPPFFFLAFFFFFKDPLSAPPSCVYLTASMGETLPAILPGFRLLK